MRDTFLAFAPPCLDDAEVEAVARVLRSGWITTGPEVARFESAFSAGIGSEGALALNSGTAALHVALAALGIGPGDAVVTTTLTFCSTVHVIEQVGARPVLCDVDPVTLNLDPRRVAEALDRHPDVRAVLPVHLYGHPCDMPALFELAARHRLAVIEDAAHALPAADPLGIVGAERSPSGVPTACCFSFYATKNLTTGEGGMLTGPAQLIERARTWSLHGMSRDAYGRYEEGGSWHYEVTLPGFKYNMTDLQAAIGLVQLGKLDGFVRRRREIAAAYTRALSGLDQVQVPVQLDGYEHAWHIYPLRLHLDRLRISRARFIAELSARRIGAGVHFIPVHHQPYYRDRYGYAPGDFPVAAREYERLVSLPLHPGLDDDDVADVIDAVTDVVAAHRR